MSFLWDWLWDLLYRFNLFKKDATILLLGIDNAGKTSLLHKLKYGLLRSVIPTQRAKLEQVDFKHVHFRAWDLGGHAQVRGMWSEYYLHADAVVFMVDSADVERMLECKSELLSLLQDSALGNTPFLILANKCDLKESLPLPALITALGIDDYLGKRKSVALFRTSLVHDIGVSDGFTWLCKQL